MTFSFKDPIRHLRQPETIKCLQELAGKSAFEWDLDNDKIFETVESVKVVAPALFDLSIILTPNDHEMYKLVKAVEKKREEKDFCDDISYNLSFILLVVVVVVCMVGVDFLSWKQV